MDYPFIVQAWIYQGDYRPSPPQLPSSPPPRCCPVPHAPTAPLGSSNAPAPCPGRGLRPPPRSPAPGANGHPHVQDDKSRTGSDAEVSRFQVLNGCSIPGGWGISSQMSRPPFFLPLLCIARCHFLNRDNDNSSWHPASVFLPHWSDIAVLMACHS